MAVQKDINEALMNDVLVVYSDAENKMLKAVAKRVAKGIKEDGWNEQKLKDTQALRKEIEKILDNTSKLAKSKVSDGIIEAYKQGKAEVEGKAGVHKTILDELDIPMNLKMLILATNNLLDNASFQVLRKADDAYQKVMAHSTTGLLAGTDTRRQASQKMLNEFASKGITSFVDKAGRNWDLSSYAEMAARTVGSHAALQGHIDRQVEVGEDLVKVSTIGTTCPICQRWQGVVLSISGNHPKYHGLEEAKAAGLFHPNCKHTLVMHIPELDGEGKVEPAPYSETTQSSKQYYEIQKQRANERKIRYWKKRKALAITPEEELKANQNIKKWQYKNLIHCEKNELRRNYAREGVMQGVVGGEMGNWGFGGSLKEYEEVFENVIGEKPKKLLVNLNLQFFGQKQYEQWLKDEIQSLDELDVDKAMMKDANNKAVTPTSLYKKYIGDNPGQDYSEVSEYEKGTKEYKSGYAKWLKQQIEEIGVSYKIKPKYVEVHEDISDEDKALSATNIYKKYYGEAPTEAYKKLGGEAGTGMKYGKWVETQKKELIKNGITKTVPFGNTVTQKTVDTISQATKVIDDAKKKLFDEKVENMKLSYPSSVWTQEDLEGELKSVQNKFKTLKKNGLSSSSDLYVTYEAKIEALTQLTSTKGSKPAVKVKNDELDAYKKELDNTVHGNYDGYLKVKEQMEAFKQDMSNSLESEKLDAAKQKHLEMVKKKADKELASGTGSFDKSLKNLEDMKAKETDPMMKAHIQNQIDVYISAKIEQQKQAEKQINMKDAKDFLDMVKKDKGAFMYSEIKANIKNNFGDKDIANIYVEAYKEKKKQTIAEKLVKNADDPSFAKYLEDVTLLDLKDDFDIAKKSDPDSVDTLLTEMDYKATKEAFDEFKKEEEKKKKEAEAKAKKAIESGKVSIGREISFKEGKLVEQSKIYNELDLADLENLSGQVAGHKLFENNNRRDILGRDRKDGHNHHMGHDVRIKTGLSGKEKELAEAFALAYDEYFNTIKCQDINLAYLKGYDKASPAMKKKINAINMAIESSELNEPIVLHRFTTQEVMKSVFKTLDFGTIDKDEVFDNDTFISAAIGGHPTFGKRNYKMTIQVDKGTHALPSLNHEELEVLLKKGKLQFVGTNKYTSSNPQKLKNYDGTYTSFVGEEVIVRYIEDGKAVEYERVTVDKVDKMLANEDNVPTHKKEANEWIKALSPEEKKATVDYTGSWYAEINDVYRRDDRSSKKVTKYAEDMTQAFRRASTTKPVVLRRGVNKSDLAHMLGFKGDVSEIENHWDEINEGIYAAEDKGFLSTSPFSSGGFSKNVELRIYCPTGTHAAHVASISNYKNEKETIIQSGSVYKVHKLKKSGGNIIVYLELLGTD